MTLKYAKEEEFPPEKSQKGMHERVKLHTLPKTLINSG